MDSQITVKDEHTFSSDEEESLSADFRIKSPTEISSDEDETYDYEDSTGDEEKTITEPKVQDNENQNNDDKLVEDLKRILNGDENPPSPSLKEEIDQVSEIRSFLSVASDPRTKYLYYLITCLVDFKSLPATLELFSRKDSPLYKLEKVDGQILKMKKQKMVLEEKAYSILLEKRKNLCSLIRSEFKQS